jgi:hypothetical protein
MAVIAKPFLRAGLLVLLLGIEVLGANAQSICFDQFCVERDPTNASKCRLLFTFDAGFLHEIECGRPGSTAPGSDAAFYAALTHFEVSDTDPNMNQRIVVYDKPNPGDCNGAITKLQYHPTMPNTVMTAYAPQFCAMGYLPQLSVTIINELGEEATCEPTNKNPLPVEWESFSGKVEPDRSITLQWKVASQINNSHFEVQKSADGTSFRNVHLERGDGTVSEERNYSFSDKSPKYGPNYYRIRQVDFDGTVDYSEVIVVSLSGRRVASIFPSLLVGNELGVELTTEKDAASIPVRIADISGNLIYQEDVAVTKGTTLHRVHLPKLPSGVYVLYVKTDGGHTEAHRFVRLEE